jgi:SNF2 family DNA or RNA helicase
LWKANKETLKNHGIAIKKDAIGNWLASFWSDPAPEYLAKLAASQADDANIVVPAPNGFEYLGYQRAGILYAHTDSTLTTLKRGVLIADEMGLGKTIEAIGIINLHPELRKVVIVVPSSLKINWRNELRKWLVDDRTVGVAKGSTLPDTDIIIINFDILKQNHHALITRNFDLLVIDEAHNVRNVNTQRYNFLKPLAAKHVVALTGTPIWNKAEDMWALLTLLCTPEELGERWSDWRNVGSKHQGRAGYTDDRLDRPQYPGATRQGLNGCPLCHQSRPFRRASKSARPLRRLATRCDRLRVGPERTVRRARMHRP